MPVHPTRSDALDFAAALGRAGGVAEGGAEGAAEQVPLTLVNDRTDNVVADVVELAVTRRTRRKGLLGRDELPSSTGMVLAPCCSIHTAFMRFPIDAAFVSRGGKVLKMVHGLKAWRMALSPRAYAVVELPAGTLRRRGVAAGDRLSFVQRTVDARSAARGAGGGR